MSRSRVLLLAFLASALIVPAAQSKAMLPKHKPFVQMSLHELASYQRLTLQRDAHSIVWWKTHRPHGGRQLLAIRLSGMPFCLGGRMPKAVCWHFKHRSWTRPLYRRTVARLEAAALPAHHSLWMCIHGHEASDWHNKDTGGNGHYGGLQMHPNWGYGTSQYASDDSQAVQERAAEQGYAASGYSRTWLLGQWAHYDCADKFA